MTKTSTRSRRLAGVLTAGFGATLLFLTAPAPALAQSVTETSAASYAPAKPVAKGATSDFRGVNWADPRDNYASDAVVPSGLKVTDDYRTVYRTTGHMVRGFKKNLGANTLRLPINPATVGTNWWKSYRATIDAATAYGDKVIVSYWEADTSKDGLVDDTAAWKKMWNTVVREYKNNPRVYFEPMNEPHGYTLDQWVSVTSGWLAQHKDVPRGRVVISGTGYNDNVTGVGAARELRGTLLSLHFYGFWASHTQQADWVADLEARIGSYAGRTIIDEAGSPMTTGLNYGAWDGNIYTSYLAAVTNTARSKGMGLVYWPGLRFGDAYSIESLDAAGNLVDNNASGVAQLRWGYGFGKTPPVNDLPAAPPGEVLRGVGSDRCVDVPGFSTTNGTQLDLWDCNDGGNQSWNWNADKQLTVYGNKCMTVGGTGATAGDPVVITDCTGAAAQQWNLNADLTVTSVANPELCLDAAGGGTGNGTAVDVWYCNASSNQQWTRS
ncbi:ricin-type beta-trefoil lectin domain protein [Streptomyces sp. NBC_00124]|uniref:ricin-type beta-trefoil lectin domain protein n=1 Tax=Streptomyces sp. NBC_00124 TaxID=2975662 RepID=UPI002256F549|nr:ricin-type beta-trefoil lectin domain protein [Streptomyces sp. NBC_00124]MCX5367045.1 ricin-type beta-trefoil lectin domain protein [Streptomyces sp. NBC_00124]